LNYFQSERSVPTSFSPLEQRVLTYAEQLTTRGNADPDLTASLLTELQQPRLMVELTGVIAIANATCRIENALQIEENI